jgi:hypothetical protein
MVLCLSLSTAKDFAVVEVLAVQAGMAVVALGEVI